MSKIIDSEVTDSEVLQVMIDGGKKLCDYAIEQWEGTKYQMSEAQRLEYKTRWKKIKEMITPLSKNIKLGG